MGWLLGAGILLLLGGFLDVLDGDIARLKNETSRYGAFLDSILDRYSESAVFLGLAICFWHSWMLVVVSLAFIGSIMVSYVRARAQGLQMDCKVGLMQRPERVVLIGSGALLNGIFGLFIPSLNDVLLKTAIILLALLAHWTALVRIRFVRKNLR